ncbi:hypothetical protein KOW79_017780 [Hemibagrus wyckioides]|uniref:Uncharacterized protein n=1 Tax=Hemibagrus wyckioides TaxID=337641 RepID=A0A9D3NAP3_9TELE|nr:hypothetical protein KOW79_017780 [Hemibagrus wyckioides]
MLCSFFSEPGVLLPSALSDRSDIFIRIPSLSRAVGEQMEARGVLAVSWSVMNYLFSLWSVPIAEEASELQRCLAQSAHCSPGLFPGNHTTCSIVCIPLCWLTTLSSFSQSATAPNESRIATRDLLGPERCADLLHVHLG